MPLANEISGPYTARIHSVTKLDEATGYHLACIAAWESQAKYEQAQEDPRTKEIEDDIGSGRITNAVPLFLAGESL